MTAAPTGTINLSAGKLLNLYAIEDINKSSTDIKKRSSFLGVRYNKDHTNDTRQELSQLPAKLIGGQAYTASGGSTLLEGTVFKTLKPADIKVGVGKYADDAAQVILAPVINQINTTHNQEKESTVWMKTVEERDTVTTGQLPKFNQTPTITSPNGVVIGAPVDVDISDNNQAKLEIQTSQAELGKIALNLSKQPGYEYLAELDKNNEINWVQVQLIQEHFKFEQEGLTPGAAALIAIAIAVASGGAGTGASASLVAAHAAGVALQTQAVITLINNKGDISKTLKDMASSDTIRNMATAALTAGVGAKLNLAGSPDYGFSQNLANGIGRGLTNAVADAALNGVSFEDALKNSLRGALVDVFAAETFGKFVKDFEGDDFASDLAHKLVAAGVGCVTASAKKQDCNAGAIGAAVGETIAQLSTSEEDELLTKLGIASPAQLKRNEDIASLTTGALALLLNVDVNTAANGANQAVKNNHNLKSANKVQISDADALKMKAMISAVLPIDTVEAVVKAVKNGSSYREIGLIIGAGGGALLLKSGKLSDLSKFLKTNNLKLATTSCSFRGDMLVQTITGYKPISEVQIGNMVLSKNEITGKLTYQSVSQHYNNAYSQTVYINIKDESGNTQTIVSNKIHPFFTQVSTNDSLPPSSEGHDYQGDIDNAQWIDASNLKAGYKLLSEDGQWQVVQSVIQTEEPLSAYNLTVNNDHTYFITGSDSAYGVWVHNNCNPAFINNIIKSQKIAPDLLVKGVHFNIGKVELKALPDNKGGVIFKQVFSSTSPAEAQKAIAKANTALESKAFREFLVKHANAGFDMSKQQGMGKALEFKMLKVALEKMK